MPERTTPGRTPAERPSERRPPGTEDPVPRQIGTPKWASPGREDQTPSIEISRQGVIRPPQRTPQAEEIPHPHAERTAVSRQKGTPEWTTRQRGPIPTQRGPPAEMAPLGNPPNERRPSRWRPPLSYVCILLENGDSIFRSHSWGKPLTRTQGAGKPLRNRDPA